VEELSEFLLTNRAINALVSLGCGVDNPIPLIGLLKRMLIRGTGLSVVLPPGDIEAWKRPSDLIELLGKVKLGDPMIEVPRGMLLLAEITRTDTDSPIEESVKTDSPIEEWVETAKSIADDDPVILRPPVELGIYEFEVELAQRPVPNNEALLRAFMKQYSIVALIAGMKREKKPKE
jgi:hypothetical protein